MLLKKLWLNNEKQKAMKENSKQVIVVNEPKKSQRGGYREGSGRKPKWDKPKRLISVRVSQEAYEIFQSFDDKSEAMTQILLASVE